MFEAKALKRVYASHVHLHVLPSSTWTAEVRPGEGGGLHETEAAPGLTAILLRPQCPAVSQESSYAGTHARLHTGTGTEIQTSLSVFKSSI